MLREAGYDPEKTIYLVNGFKHGFSLGYQGPSKVARKAANLKWEWDPKLSYGTK